MALLDLLTKGLQLIQRGSQLGLTICKLHLWDVGWLNFLDLTLKAMNTGKITHQHYQKPTASGRYLHPDAYCSLVTAKQTSSEQKHVGSFVTANEGKNPGHIWRPSKFKHNLVTKSVYPTKIVTTHILIQAMEQTWRRKAKWEAPTVRKLQHPVPTKYSRSPTSVKDSPGTLAQQWRKRGLSQE